MDDNTLTILTALAAKFGTTVEALWGVLLRQAVVAGVYDLFEAGLLLGAMLAMLRYTHLKTRKTEDKDGWKRAKLDEELAVAAWAVTVGLGCILSLFVLADLKEAAVSLLSPDYWALQQVLSLLKR